MSGSRTKVGISLNANSRSPPSRYGVLGDLGHMYIPSELVPTFLAIKLIQERTHRCCQYMTEHCDEIIKILDVYTGGET